MEFYKIGTSSNPTPTSPNIHYISANSVNAFKNQLPLSGQTGVGVALSGNYLTVNHTEWKNAVAYETYDSAHQVIFVSISGTGDASNQFTHVYFPSSAKYVFAVGYNGQRILVYPLSQLSLPENASNQASIFPNPIIGNQKIKLSLPSEYAEFDLHVLSVDGKEIGKAHGNSETIENAINQLLFRSENGMYLIHVSSKNQHVLKEKIVKN